MLMSYMIVVHVLHMVWMCMDDRHCIQWWWSTIKNVCYMVILPKLIPLSGMVWTCRVDNAYLRPRNTQMCSM